MSGRGEGWGGDGSLEKAQTGSNPLARTHTHAHVKPFLAALQVTRRGQSAETKDYLPPKEEILRINLNIGYSPDS